jgi:hypothetical protein
MRISRLAPYARNLLRQCVRSVSDLEPDGSVFVPAGMDLLERLDLELYRKRLVKYEVACDWLR